MSRYKGGYVVPPSEVKEEEFNDMYPTKLEIDLRTLFTLFQRDVKMDFGSIPTSCYICEQPWEESFLLMACSSIVCKSCYSKCGHDKCAWCRTSTHHVSGTLYSFMTLFRQYLIVSCPNEKCKDTMLLSHVKTHLHDKCSFQLVPCTWCQESVVRDDMSEHKRETCPKREVTCSKCGSELSFEMLHDHVQIFCPEECTTCQLCSLRCLRKELDMHVKQECPKVVVTCKYDGCDVTLTREKMYQHETSICLKREVSCQYCELKLRADYLSEHEVLCPFRMRTCPVCNEVVTLRFLFVHTQKHCPKGVKCCSEPNCAFWTPKNHKKRGNFKDSHTCPQPFSTQTALQTLRPGMLLDVKFPDSTWNTALFLDVVRDEFDDVQKVSLLWCIDKDRFGAHVAHYSGVPGTFKVAPAWSMNTITKQLMVPLARLNRPDIHFVNYFRPKNASATQTAPRPPNSVLVTHAFLPIQPTNGDYEMEIRYVDLEEKKHIANADDMVVNVDVLFQSPSWIWVSFHDKRFMISRMKFQHACALSVKDLVPLERYTLVWKDNLTTMSMKLIRVNYDTDEKTNLLSAILVCSAIEDWEDWQQVAPSTTIPIAKEHVHVYPWNFSWKI